jgi:hypothetical protein
LSVKGEVHGHACSPHFVEHNVFLSTRECIIKGNARNITRAQEVYNLKIYWGENYVT